MDFLTLLQDCLLLLHHRLIQDLACNDSSSSLGPICQRLRGGIVSIISGLYFPVQFCWNILKRKNQSAGPRSMRYLSISPHFLVKFIYPYPEFEGDTTWRLSSAMFHYSVCIDHVKGMTKR